MRRALVVLFALTIGVPLAATISGGAGGGAAAENRDLAKFPRWDGSWTSTRAYPDAFTRWFEDHFAFRATLVRWYGESRLFGFGVSPSSAVVKGDEGWLFYG